MGGICGCGDQACLPSVNLVGGNVAMIVITARKPVCGERCPELLNRPCREAFHKRFSHKQEEQQGRNTEQNSSSRHLIPDVLELSDEEPDANGNGPGGIRSGQQQ